MKCLVCEGKNDLHFFQDFLSKYSEKQGYPVYNVIEDFFDIFHSDFHPFHRKDYGCVIFGEGGKKKLFEHVVMPLIQEVFARKGYEHRFLVVLDADGAKPDGLCAKYCQVIKDHLVARKTTRYTCECSLSNACYSFLSPIDRRYRCLVKTAHLPQSLERELVLKGIEHNKGRIGKKAQDNMLNMPIHQALETLAKKLNMTTEELIGLSIKEGWFVKEAWFIEIHHELESFFGLKAVHENISN